MTFIYDFVMELLLDYIYNIQDQLRIIYVIKDIYIYIGLYILHLGLVKDYIYYKGYIYIYIGLYIDSIIRARKFYSEIADIGRHKLFTQTSVFLLA